MILKYNINKHQSIIPYIHMYILISNKVSEEFDAMRKITHQNISDLIAKYF